MDKPFGANVRPSPSATRWTLRRVAGSVATASLATLIGELKIVALAPAGLRALRDNGASGESVPFYFY